MRGSRVLLAWLFVFSIGAYGSALAAPGAAGYDPERDPAQDLEVAKAEATREGKRILLEVGGEWCSWCHRLESFVRDNDEVATALHERFVVVKVNWSEENENQEFLSAYPAIRGYPHMFVLDADGTLLHSQNTGELEAGASYDTEKFLQFVRSWGGPRE